MFGFAKWREIYFGNDINEFFRIQNSLHNEAIRFKAKTDSCRDRMSRDTMAGGDPLILNTAGMSNTENYTILVKEEDESKACQIISQKN